VWGYGEEVVDVLFDVAEGWEEFRFVAVGPYTVFWGYEERFDVLYVIPWG
jgi:hypothetical protein